MQQHGISALHQGVDRQAMLAGKLADLCTQIMRESYLHLPVTALRIGAVHHQWSGRGEAGQVVPPERMGALEVLLLQPGNVLAVWARARDHRRQIFIQRKQFLEQDLPTPAVGEQVMTLPYKLVAGLPHPHQQAARQRRLVQRKPAHPLRRQQALQPLCLLRLRQPAPVLLLPWEFHLLVHDLHRLGQPFPHKRRPQNGMPFHHQLPGSPPERHIQPAIDAKTVLQEVHPRSWRQDAVEQHPRLHRRKRVNVFHPHSPSDQPVQFCLRQPAEGEI